MGQILGLDLGTNSIGWAVINSNEEKILGMGSRIFPMGVENIGEGEKELSKNASRTEARGARRQFFRRRLRKKMLLKELSKDQMCPLTHADIKKWNKTKKFPHSELKEWFKLNPYELRTKALEESLSLYELGRVFYHLIQRRGFLSNSRKNKSADGAIFKGMPKEGKIGINETMESIENSTLGSYLFRIAPKPNEAFRQGERIRNRYTTRQMYYDEFDLIWEKQSQFHTALNEELRIKYGGRKEEGDNIDGILFHQRSLRSQKHLKGNCTLEPQKHRCQVSAIPFEKFRIYQWVNTLECNGVKIAQEDRETIAQFLFRNEKSTFKKLRVLINKQDSSFKFNYKDEDKIVGSHTISKLSSKSFFGESWFGFTNKEQEDIWHVLHFFDSKKNLREYAIKKWGFNESKAAKIADFNLKDDYANLSRKAILNILPFLKQGFAYDISVVLGGIKNAFGNKWEKLKEDQKELILNHVPDLVRAKIRGGFIEEIKSFLRSEFELGKKDLDKLYHHSAIIKANTVLDKLPTGKEADREIQSIRNPVVIAALFELRKVVNALLEKFGPFDEIKVEMARELKQSKSQRYKVRKEQQRLEKENDRIRSEVEKYKRPTHENILKFKLWEECKHTCPYTGKTIPINELFGGKWQIEHIHPWSRSLNDSFMNKTLCDADENRKKGNQTPFEFYSVNEAKWEEVKERALKLFSDTKEYPAAYQKFKRFVKQKFDEDFTSKQLNDTRYISKEAKNYLMQICSKVNVSPGQITAKLRHLWGLNEILNQENEKSREDHRHHAIDALVVACTKLSYVQELSKWNRYNRPIDVEGFSEPWNHFFSYAKEATDSILVSHRRENKILSARTYRTRKEDKLYENLGVSARGQLHKESVYGKRQPPLSDEAFHIRKPITELKTEKQIKKVVDPVIRKLIFERIEKIGGFENAKVPQNTFYEANEEGKLLPQIFLPNRNGDPVPVLKVRMSENLSGAAQLKERENKWVNPRNNHHVLIYKNEKGDLKEDVVTFWTVVERKRNGLPVYQLPEDGVEIVETLHINDIFLLNSHIEEVNSSTSNKNLLRNLYRVQKITSKDYFFRQISTSSILNPIEKIQIRSLGEGKNGWFSFNPLKVFIDAIGEIKISSLKY